MAIQMRRGALANYDADKMLPGEFGGAVDEDELFISFGTGNSKRVLTEDDMENIRYTFETIKEKAIVSIHKNKTLGIDKNPHKISKNARYSSYLAFYLTKYRESVCI